MKAIELLREQFGDFVRLEEKRPNIQQVFAPLYHEDGDMMDVFLNLPKDANLLEGNQIRISDHGMTLMRLSYNFDLDTPNKEKIFQRILLENGVSESEGEIYLETTPDSLYPALMQFSQAVGKVSNMRLFRRETLHSLFEEMLKDFIQATLARFQPKPSICPIPDRDDLEVDWLFTPNGTPLYLFGVKDNARARLATISCLEFQRNKLPFRSMIVHEDFDTIARKDKARLTSACDKQFTSLDDFKQNAEQYLLRETGH
ncbi:MAG: hypothetical protein DDT26_02603 [Dehalococcoidia bacterium]|nr:hypothetical protein [Chloroflexota bacterium]